MNGYTARRGAILFGCALAAPAAAPTLAHAAALERAVPSVVRLLYEDGTYGEVSAVYTRPDLEGKNGQLPPSLGGAAIQGKTGNLLGSDWKFGAALKGDINEQLSYLLPLRPALCRQHLLRPRQLSGRVQLRRHRRRPRRLRNLGRPRL